MNNKITGRLFSYYKAKEPSISNNLALSLSFIVFLVLLTLLALLYVKYSQDMVKDLDKKADEHISRITGILAPSVWNIDEKSIVGIATEFAHSELVHAIKVMDIDKSVIFEIEDPADEFLKIKRIGKIIYNDRLLGYAEILLSLKRHERELSRVFKLTALIFTGSALVIYFATGILLRVFLRRPLYDLNQGMTRIANGDFSYKIDHVRHKELSGIIKNYIKMNQKVKDRENAFASANKMLKQEIAERIRAENINKTLFNISNAVNTTQKLDDLYRFIHKTLGNVINVNNFFIALYNKKHSTIVFPYYTDEVDSDYPDIKNFTETGSLTGEVILSKKPLMLTDKDFNNLAGTGTYEFQGTRPKIWLGVPLIIKDEIVGVMATQSYTNPEQYNESDLEIFASVSGQVAIAIERKQAEEALRESESKFKNLFDLSPQCIFLEDIETEKLIDVNIEFCNFTDLGHHELINRNTRELNIFSSQDKDIFLNRLKQSKEIHGMEMPFSLKKGVSGQAIVSAKIIRIEERDLVLNVLVDITEQKKALQEKQELQERLARSKKMEALGLLAGGVAHDLNNILSGIVSYPDLLLMDIDENSKLRKPVETIKLSGQRAAAVVSDLLTLARGIASTKEIMNLNNIINEYLESPEFENIKSDKPDITISINPAPDLLNISCSSIHLKKVLMNLVNNAIEAIDKKGEIVISTCNTYIDRPVKGYDEVCIGEYAVLSVKDTGSGISPEDRERIFEPFYTRKVMGRSGTGLGLAVVWNTVQDHQGYIDVISSSKGTVFELYFPVDRGKISCVEKDMTMEDFQGNREKILVIDDEKHQQVIACELLNKLGYDTKAVSSGKQAIKYLQKHDVDLILLDMIMPEMNGSETYEKIVKISPGQKAIITSGFAETSDVKKTQKLGAGIYIKKPYTLEKIAMAVKSELSE